MHTPKSYTLIVLFLITCQACGENLEITAFKNTHLVTMTEEKIISSQTVLVKGDRIHQIGPADEIEMPPEARIIDGQGAYLMPGLADMHVHLKGDWPLPQFDLYLASGVTTIRDLDGREFMQRWRAEIKNGKRMGPTLYMSRPVIQGYEKNPAELVAKNISGYDCVKLYSYFSVDDFNRAMHFAKKHRLYTVGHIPFAVGLDGVIAAGMDEIAHIEELSFELIDFDRTKNLKPREWLPYVIHEAMRQNDVSSGFDPDKISRHQRDRLASVIHRLQEADLPVCSTLVVDEVINQKLFHPDAFLARAQNLYLPQNYREAFLQGKEKHQVQFKGIENLVPFKYKLDLNLLIECHRAGIPVVLGTDAGTGGMGIVPGFSIHDELRILVENGFSPYEAIAAATVNASAVVEAMTGINDFGTIEVGKRADFILVDENPLEDVARIKNHRGVMAAGKWYEGSYLLSIVNPALLPATRIWGNVMQVRQADNSLSTDIEIVFHEHFPRQLPVEIDSIGVKFTDSKGNTSALELPQYTFFEQFRDYWFRLPGPPALGKYTFTVKSKDLTMTAKDFQMVNRKIPLPNVRTFSPPEGQTLTARAPVFRWAPVEYSESAIYYRLVIEDLSGIRVFASKRVLNMTDCRVPEGVLKPGQTYRYRVRVLDNAGWVEIQNRSDSDWVNINMAE